MEQESTTKEEIREAWWWEAEKRRSNRLNYLRKAVWPKDCKGGDYVDGVLMGLDKFYWWTKVFKETDSMPWVHRRAMALATLLRNQPVYIIDQSQLLGYAAARPNEVLYQPDAGYLIPEDNFHDKRDYVPEDEKWWVSECLSYWRDKCFQAQCERYMSDEEMAITKMSETVLGSIYIDGIGSSVIDYEFAFETGLNNIIKMIEDKLDEAEDTLCSGPATPDTLYLHEKIDQWRAMKLSAEAVVDWANRHSRLAKIVAENFETDPKRQAELLKISDICAKVPAEPAETLHEALQCERFVGLVSKMIERFHGGWGHRIDQDYWPYYKKEVLEDKTLTRQEAVELFGENNIRLYENTFMVYRVGREAEQGATIYLPTLTIGGVDQDGNDACNELTEVVLEACRLVRVGEPSYMFRYHPGSSVSALRACYETICHGLGYPSFEHDRIAIDTLMHNYGATLDESRRWCNVVCMSPGVTKGRGGQGVRYASAVVIAAKVFELAFHDGFSNVSQMQLGPHTGDASKFETFEELFEAWRQQVRYAFEVATRTRNKGRYMEAKYLQQPFGSCLFKRCIESGMDMVDARSEPLSNAWVTVLCNNEVGDSMYAVKKLVFEDKKYTMEQLITALRGNWVGDSEMRQDFLNAPKFGNDIAEVDQVTALCYKAFAEECNRNVEWGGGRFMPLPENVASWAAFAPRIGALPNGRRLGDALYDGGISPGAGMDKKGPTAVLRSVSKVDATRYKQILLNQRLSPSQLAGEKGFQLWMNYMKTWYDLNIPHVQFNMVDNETLRAAQREPEKYQELIVRVAGYSAHFVELNALTQEGIIERTVQEI